MHATESDGNLTQRNANQRTQAARSIMASSNNYIEKFGKRMQTQNSDLY